MKLMSMRALNVAIVGFGVSARYFHLPLLLCNRNFQVSAIVSSRIKEIHELYPNTAVFKTIHELLEAKPQLVVVASPSHTHFEIAKLCIEAGIHTVIEKPFVTSVAEGEELLLLAQKKGTLLSVFHNRRWD